MAITKIKTIAVVKVLCENCGNRFSFEEEVTISHRGYLPNYEKLEKEKAQKKYRPHKCPNCRYVQSWMWDNYSPEILMMGLVVFLALFIGGILTKKVGIVWWLALILGIIIGGSFGAILDAIISNRVKKKYLPLLRSKGFMLTNQSISNLAKRIKGFDFHPMELKKLMGKTFESQAEIVSSIFKLEGGSDFWTKYWDSILMNTIKNKDCVTNGGFCIIDRSISFLRKIIPQRIQKSKFNPDVLESLKGKHFETEDELFESIRTLDGGDYLISNYYSKIVKSTSKAIRSLKNQKYYITDISIKNITKDVINCLYFNPDNFNTLKDKNFETEDELIDTIRNLEGGEYLISNLKGIIVKEALKSNEPEVTYKKPLA